VRIAYDCGVVALHAKIKVKIEGEKIETTVGRVLLKEILPDKVPFRFINKVMAKKDVARLITESYHRAGLKATVILCDKLKDWGFEQVLNLVFLLGLMI